MFDGTLLNPAMLAAAIAWIEAGLLLLATSRPVAGTLAAAELALARRRRS
ncbi:MAG TPA: hypothetical protein VMI56_00475 [Reyranella sp.]|nr:hypothetical protein [Reyranella sp.]HTY68760.1 hypothetical protein [Alphaproteobacteria bacterium]